MGKRKSEEGTEQRFNKKWTDEEIGEILQYLKNHTDVEKPTAQIYYRDFLKTSNLDATWTIIKWKVRYLKLKFINAEKERAKGRLDKAQLHKICRYYSELKEIFGGKKLVQMAIKRAIEKSNSHEKTRTNNNNNNPITPPTDETSCDMEFQACSLDSSDDCTDLETLESCNSLPAEAIDSKPVLFLNGLNDNVGEVVPTRNPIDLQDDLTNNPAKLKLELEYKKFTQNLEFERYKFDAEMNLKLKEFLLKKEEIEKDERLRIAEMEKDERLAKYELDLKYNKNKS